MGKDLCVNEDKVSLTSFFKEEKQNQIKPCAGKENIFKIIWIQHKENKELNEIDHKIKYLYHSFDKRCMSIGSYILWIYIHITLTLMCNVCWMMVFDP